MSTNPILGNQSFQSVRDLAGKINRLKTDHIQTTSLLVNKPVISVLQPAAPTATSQIFGETAVNGQIVLSTASPTGVTGTGAVYLSVFASAYNKWVSVALA